MAAKRLTRKFFNRPTLRVARELLGKTLVHQKGRQHIEGMICETEAYKGPLDQAAHTFGGRRTARVEAMYDEGGVVYVYFIYGMHWMLNISTAGAGKPEAVLIRAVVTPDEKRIEGPARVCRYLQVDKKFYGEDLVTSKHLWVEDRGVMIGPSQIMKGPRVGIDYAGPHWAARLWRFLLKDKV